MSEPIEESGRGSSRSWWRSPITALSTSLQLWIRGRRGDRSALDRLFRRLLPDLAGWARGRLPSWARRRVDTEDLVQETFFNILHRLPRVEPRRKQALRAYLKQAIRNRIRDEVRRAGRVEVSGSSVEPLAGGSSPLHDAISTENAVRYRSALRRLSDLDQQLIAGRLELDLSYEQLALAVGKQSPDAARVAVRRALLRLAEEMELD